MFPDRELIFLRSTLSKSRSKLFPSKTKEKEEEVFDASSGPKTPILDTYKENTMVEENDDEDFGSFSYDDEYYSESDLEEPKREEEKKYSRLERLRRSRSRSRSFSRSRSRSRSQSKSRWEEEAGEEENNVRRGRRKPSRSTTEGVVKRSGNKQPIEESPRGGERSKRGVGSRAEEHKRYMRMGKYGRGVATTDEETEERGEDFEDEEDTIDRRRSRKNSRRSYATDEDEDEDGDERRLEVHQSREELDQEDKPAMQVITIIERPSWISNLLQALKKTFSQMLSRMPWMSSQADTSDISDNCSTISRWPGMHIC